MRPGLRIVGMLLLFSTGAWPQAEPGVDQKKVDEAIARGVEFLKAADVRPLDDRTDLLPDELVLWTFLHAGVPYDDPRFQALWKKVVSRPLERTYDVALLAMILEEVDRVRYQTRIAHCAQFLVDNQCKNGRWDYGTQTLAVPAEINPKELELPKAPPVVKGKRTKPKVVRKVIVRKTRDVGEQGCNSNAQFAALGLRACHDAGVLIPKDVISLAKSSWTESQHGEKDRPGSGWCYGNPVHRCVGPIHPPTSAMTAGGVGSLIIYDYMLGIDWAKDAAVKDGIAWLEKAFSFKENGTSKVTCPARRRNGQFQVFYAVYALERVGRLARIDRIGERLWYPEGVGVLLEGQKKDGSWGPCDYTNPSIDTCFAILFLKRATRPLNDVASEDRFVPVDKEK
jgi:hypothetical protein